MDQFMARLEELAQRNSWAIRWTVVNEGIASLTFGGGGYGLDRIEVVRDASIDTGYVLNLPWLIARGGQNAYPISKPEDITGVYDRVAAENRK
jgi:hypothetical protein